MQRVVVAAFFVVACSAQQPIAASSPGPATAMSSASPSPSPSPTTASSTCRLPVIQGSPGQGSGPQTAGFLSLPGNQFTSAPDAGSGMFYDRPLKRWIGWGPPAMSPDGTRYAYSEFITETKTSRVHLVDVASGTDRIVASGGPWLGVGLDGDAFYVERIELMTSAAYGTIEVGKGLWKLPLDGTQPTQLTSDARNWAWIGNGAAYADRSTVDVAGGPNTVTRLDLKTLQETTWLDVHARTSVLAVDTGGAVLAMSEAADEELWRTTGPGNAVKVWSGSTNVIRPGIPVAIDGADVWFSSDSPTSSWAIYHYSVQAGLEQAAVFTDRPVTVAGPCA
jgi:hypothetical protein